MLFCGRAGGRQSIDADYQNLVGSSEEHTDIPRSPGPTRPIISTYAEAGPSWDPASAGIEEVENTKGPTANHNPNFGEAT